MPHRINTTSPPTERQIRACLPFDLRLHTAATPDVPCSARAIEQSVQPGRITLLTGPSGSGKSTALRNLEQHLRTTGHRVEIAHFSKNTSTRLIDIFSPRMPVADALRLLTHFGLGEPALVARTISELSQGQRHRAELAFAFHRALTCGAGWLLIDEFASVLDRLTARGLAITLARAVRKTAMHVVCATAHDDVAAALDANPVIRFDLDGSMSIAPPRLKMPRSPRLLIEPGTLGDLDQLLKFHYRAGRPATCVGVLRAVDQTSGVLAGVLAVSMPTLNGGWRNLAWPGRYAGPDRRAITQRINEELRCISRVIIEPRFRGLGLARTLVEHYLASPRSPATEAITAMGEICPFFERAGMVAYRLALSTADSRLADALEHRGFEPWMLADEHRVARITQDQLIARELARWATARKIVDDCPLNRASLAASRLCARSVAYAHVFPPIFASQLEAPRGKNDTQNKCSAAATRSR
ncbi:MAG: ATP-binding cassette domain-containing protein [Phycisphaeraceae bacterium]|nr:ATP-binding cassette domain-containing protein [Phycisphaeraceae bacterium]MCW5764038.1 ATP-binding cassette domain-containing protein [Phycisphaeraceae bacterium]